MHSKKSTSGSTSAAEAVHQAALNVHNTNNLPSDLRHSHIEPAAHPELRQGMTSQQQQQQQQMNTSNTSHVQAPVFHDDKNTTRNSNLQGQNISAPMNVQGHNSQQQQQQQQQYNTSTASAAPLNQGMSNTRTTNTVQSVTRDAQAQIDAQVAEALAKSRALNAQDHARLQSSIGSATASLEQQAQQLKAQIDEEKRRAEQSIRETQQEKLQSTAARQSMEEKAILEAAAARKLELEQKSMRLQQEIDEITRRKTAEMMAEKPGHLQFTHEAQDATVTAHLAGDIGHALDIKKGGHITNTTMGGEVQYHPVQVQETSSMATQAAQASSQSQTGPHIHEQRGGMLHAMKTAITGTDSYNSQQSSASVPLQQSTMTTQTQGLKQGPAAGRAYDEQSQWANQSDKLAQK